MISELFAKTVRAHRKLFVVAILTLCGLTWAAVAAALWLLGTVLTGLPPADAVRNIGSMARATTVFDMGDAPAFTIFKEQRLEVPLSRMSPHIVDAIVAVEDQRFFDHGGLDIIRVAGAAWKNLRDGWGTQGGSTITQQLARQSFFTSEKTISRKLKEIIVAGRLEDQFTKKHILELYLNKVYFGDGLYGVEAASLGYFGKHAADLNVAEAALLAGVVKAPSTSAPTINLARATARRNAALQAMHKAGRINSTVYQAAIDTKVRLTDALRDEESYGQYFKEEVRKQLVQQFGWERVYQGGLKVYTTLDLEVQKAAEAEVGRAVLEIEERQAARRGKRSQSTDQPLQAALVALDPHTGEVRAMVGGRNFDDSRFNRATQARRQAGSAFKPFVYAAALERGYTPASLITALDVPVMTLQGAWVPDDHSASVTAMTMRSALKASSNRAAVRMLQEIGIPAAVRAAQRLGLGSVPGVPSLALGSGEVTLLSMTAAYATFANAGMRPEPILIRRVEDTAGDVLFIASPRAERAVSEATAFLVTSIMSDVVNGGTGWQARRVGLTGPAAGKTGTTNDYHDAWFVGYTPHLAAGVWIGYDQPREIIARGYAGTLAVPLWGRFMTRATHGHEPEPFRAPKTVTSARICRLSGKRATATCSGVETYDAIGNVRTSSMVYTEYFVRGTVPHEYCDQHTPMSGGGVVAVSTPSPRAPAAPAPPLPAPIATTGILPSALAAPGAPTLAAPRDLPTTAPPPARRGFWRRIFSRGGRSETNTPAPNDMPAPPPAPESAR
jgi:penicillin-binding protein 1A